MHMGESVLTTSLIKDSSIKFFNNIGPREKEGNNFLIAATDHLYLTREVKIKRTERRKVTRPC